MKTSQPSENSNHSNQARDWFDSGHHDIARMIERTIAPYVDNGNVALQHDELRDGCWFKVAKLLSGSSLDRCDTRQQFFGFIKVSLKNHIRSVVHKYVFTVKYTGIPISPQEKTSKEREARKTRYVRLDNPNELFELAADASKMEAEALLSDFRNVLSASERLTLEHMIAAPDECDAVSARWLRTRYDEFLQG